MKILFKILIGIVGFIALLLLLALFVSRDYRVEREIAINKPRQDVFNYLKNLRNQDHYNKWIMMDPGMEKKHTGMDGAVGSTYAWDSEKVGKGIQEIKNIRDGERIDHQIHFIEPFEGTANTSLITETSSDGTKVRWTMEGRSPYPLNLMNLFMGKTLGKHLESSLQQLKGVLEKS